MQTAPAIDTGMIADVRRKLPSLAALEAFEAVSRLGSTTRAASELARTQSAVSRQILNLEALTACPLFERINNRLVLNPAGSGLLEAVERTLGDLEHAVARAAAHEASEQRLTIRVWPTFGARWLMARMIRFPQAELGLRVELSIGVDASVDTRSSNTDAIILYGTGEWKGMVAYPLVHEQLVAVATPLLLRSHGPDIAAYPWLELQTRPNS